MRIFATVLVAILFATPAAAHFLELVPTPDIVTPESGAKVSLDIRFTHPMENGPVMPMAEPVRFGVVAGGVARDLKPALRAVDRDGARAYVAEYAVAEPGDHLFFIEPAPYWEPAEGVQIIHYAKVVVDGLGGGGSWDAAIGLPVEIVPLARPYGLWTGNLFRGEVRKNGAPVPFATVEVEYRSEGAIKAPGDAYVTQEVKADANGVFAYAMPRAGWWGFAALVEGDAPMAGPDGKMVPVELGGLIWVKTIDMP